MYPKQLIMARLSQIIGQFILAQAFGGLQKVSPANVFKFGPPFLGFGLGGQLGPGTRGP